MHGGALCFDEDLVCQTGLSVVAMYLLDRMPSPCSAALPVAHQDTILDVKAIEFPQKMLATASRDGTVKVFL